jgi:ferredoxin
MKYATCEQCGKGYKKFSSHQRYCSDECRFKAYRRRKDNQVGSSERARQQKEKRVSTMRSELKDVVCEQCGISFKAEVIRTSLMYCSNACKQKAYRERTKNHRE